MHFVKEYISTKTRLHEGPLTFKQSSSYELFWCFHFSFSYCYVLDVHLHHDLVTTFELSHISTKTLNNVFFFLSEINIFNNLLLFAWHDIAFLWFAFFTDFVFAQCSGVGFSCFSALLPPGFSFELDPRGRPGEDWESLWGIFGVVYLVNVCESSGTSLPGLSRITGRWTVVVLWSETVLMLYH